jgi:hypothetical protein
MKLIDTKDWKAVHFKDRTILRVTGTFTPNPSGGADSYGGSGTDG